MIEGPFRRMYMSALERSSPEAADFAYLVRFSFQCRQQRHQRSLQKLHQRRKEQIERLVEWYYGSVSGAGPRSRSSPAQIQPILNVRRGCRTRNSPQIIHRG